MSSAPTLAELQEDAQARLQEQLRQAYELGLTNGRVLERTALLGYLNNISPGALAAASPNAIAKGLAGEVSFMVIDPSGNDADEAQRRQKAPKGLAEQIIRSVLSKEPNLTLPEIEERVLAADHRVARKTVYNQLNAGRDTTYRFQNHRWSLRDTVVFGGQGGPKPGNQYSSVRDMDWEMSPIVTADQRMKERGMT